jgi:hypothetical protein
MIKEELKKYLEYCKKNNLKNNDFKSLTVYFKDLEQGEINNDETRK